MIDDYNVWYQYINFNMAGYHTVFWRSYLFQTIMLSCLESMQAYPTCSPGCLYYWQVDHLQIHSFWNLQGCIIFRGLCESLLLSINKCNGMGWNGISDIWNLCFLRNSCGYNWNNLIPIDTMKFSVWMVDNCVLGRAVHIIMISSRRKKMDDDKSHMTWCWWKKSCTSW